MDSFFERLKYPNNWYSPIRVFQKDLNTLTLEAMHKMRFIQRSLQQCEIPNNLIDGISATLQDDQIQQALADTKQTSVLTSETNVQIFWAQFTFLEFYEVLQKCQDTALSVQLLECYCSFQGILSRIDRQIGLDRETLLYWAWALRQSVIIDDQAESIEGLEESAIYQTIHALHKISVGLAGGTVTREGFKALTIELNIPDFKRIFYFKVEYCQRIKAMFLAGLCGMCDQIDCVVSSQKVYEIPLAYFMRYVRYVTEVFLIKEYLQQEDMANSLFLSDRLPCEQHMVIALYRASLPSVEVDHNLYVIYRQRLTDMLTNTHFNAFDCDKKACILLMLNNQFSLEDKIRFLQENWLWQNKKLALNITSDAIAFNTATHKLVLELEKKISHILYKDSSYYAETALYNFRRMITDYKELFEHNVILLQQLAEAPYMLIDYNS